eukprot:scaffold4635_cov267-Pinguiococcus_pyrenoidosus.AAC.4
MPTGTDDEGSVMSGPEKTLHDSGEDREKEEPAVQRESLGTLRGPSRRRDRDGSSPKDPFLLHLGSAKDEQRPQHQHHRLP